MGRITKTSSNEHVNNLEHCSLFSDLSLQSLQQSCPSARIQIFEDRSPIYNQGNRCGDIFCILSGQVKLASADYNGNEFTIGFLQTGELFGPSLGSFEALDAQETATPKGSVAVWRVPAKEFRDLLHQHPTLSMRVIGALAQRQRKMERRLECFALKQTEARLAQTLRELSDCFEMRCEHGFGMHIRLTQQELADLVGASRSVVSTILNQLRKKGVLNYNREYLCVRGIEEIEQLIEK